MLRIKNVRIIYVVPNIIGFTGDAINEKQLAEALSKYSFIEIFSLISLSKIKELKKYKMLNSSGINIYLIPIIRRPYILGIILTLMISLLIAVIVALKKPTLIYIRTSHLALPFIWLKKLHRAKVIVKIPTITEIEVTHNTGRYFMFDKKVYLWFISFADKYVLAYADRIVTESNHLYIELCKRRRLKHAKPPILAPAGININKLKTINISLMANEFEKDEFIIGFIGSLTWWQGVEILVKALNEINHKCKLYLHNINFKLLIIGDGPNRKAIEKLCKDLFVNCKITGFVPHETALKLLRNLDVLVLPRLRTTVTEFVLPIKVIEAWALGVPVIVTRHRIFESLGLKDGEALIYCEPDPSSVAEAICRLIRDPSLKLKLRLAGPKLAQMFDYDNIARNLLRSAKV